VVVGGVKWLVQIADEVEKELQRQEVLGSAGGRIAELGRELIDLVNHAGLRRAFRSRYARRKRRMAETRCDKIGLREFDVHEVPAPCCLVADPGRVAVAVPILIGPCRLAGDVVARQAVGVGREQCRHLVADSRVEVGLGDKGDDLVTFVALSKRGTRARQGNGEQKPNKEKTLWGSPVHVVPCSNAVASYTRTLHGSFE
jgi:hypothetical protein